MQINPQGFVPALETDDGAVLTQSLAICEWLDETHPQPRLLPGTALHRARIRAVADVIACDIHPLQNQRVLNRVRAMCPGADAKAWARWVIEGGLAACAALLRDQPGPFCFGSAPTLADICLVPQLANARRFGSDPSRHPRLLAAESACAVLPAFIAAAPERQPDFEA